MYIPHLTNAGRYRGLAEREDVPEEQRGVDYDFAFAYVDRFAQGVDPVLNARLTVDGEPYGLPYWKAWTWAPACFRALMGCGVALMKHQGEPEWKSYSMADHEMIDLVLGFDSGYWGLHGAHTPNAISAGIRIEAIEALADGREEELNDDERQQVEFIRAVRDGQVTDDIWARMVERLGSHLGAVEFAFFTCYLWVHHRMCWAMGVAAVDEGEWRQRIAEYKAGTKDPADETSQYVWEALDPNHRREGDADLPPTLRKAVRPQPR